MPAGWAAPAWRGTAGWAAPAWRGAAGWAAPAFLVFLPTWGGPVTRLATGCRAAQPFLVYRDRIGVPSEIEFLRRQYIGFTRLRPVWTGRTVLPGAVRIGEPVLRLGGDGLLGPVHRMLFRYLGWVRLDFPPRGWAGQAHPEGGAGGAGTVGVWSGDRGAILHAQFARGGALALPLVQALGLRMVVTLHGGDVGKRKNWSGTLLARRWPAVVGATECFVCVSDAVAETAGRRGVPDAKLTVLPIGVEVPGHPPVRRTGEPSVCWPVCGEEGHYGADRRDPDTAERAGI